MKFAIAILFAALAAVSAKESDLKDRLTEYRDDQFRDNHSTLAAIKENHERRMAALEVMINDRIHMTADHESGRRRLSDEDYERASRQVRNFQLKLDEMKKRSDEDHVERLDDLKAIHNMNRVDYLDIKEKLGAM